MTDKVDFDDYAQDYNQLLQQQVKFFDKDHDYFSEYKVKLAREMMGQQLCRRVLDFGCGIGRSIPFFKAYFPSASIHGCDISQQSLAYAKAQHTHAEFHLTNDLVATERRFDLVFLAGVMHHVPMAERQTLVRSLVNMLQPGGQLIIFEHNPYNPVTRRMVSTCEFDRDAVLLSAKELQALLKSAGATVQLARYTLFFPAFLRWLRVIEPLLFWLPLGGQYVVSATVQEDRA